MKIAWGRGKQTTEVENNEYADFKSFTEDLEDALLTHRSKGLSKDQAFWFLRGEATKRNDASMVRGWILIADVDHTNVPPKRASLLLQTQGIPHFIYTSSSHTDGAPRYRILVPYETSSHEECKRATAFLQDAIPTIEFAEESYRWSQFWYVSVNCDKSGIFKSFDGEFSVPEKYKFDKKLNGSKHEPEQKSEDSEDFATCRDRMLATGDLHTNYVKMITSMMGHGADDKIIEEAIWPFIEIAVKLNNRTDVDLSKRREVFRQAIKSQREFVRSTAKVKEAPRYIDISNTYINRSRSNKFTFIPEPPGFLRRLTEYTLTTMHKYQYEIAVVTAEHIVSTFGGGMFHLRGNTTMRKRILLGETGVGKATPGKIFSKIIDEIKVQVQIQAGGNPQNAGIALYSGTDSFSFLPQHKHLADFRVRSYIINEAGQIGQSRAGDLATLRGYELDLLSTKANSIFMLKKEYSDKERKDIPKIITNPCAVYLHESTPGAYSKYFSDSDAFESGDAGRSDIFIVDPVCELNKNVSIDKPIPEDIQAAIKLMITKFNSEYSTAGDRDKTNYSLKVRCDEIDYSEIEEDLIKLSDACHNEANEYYRTDKAVMKAIKSRRYEKILCTILICAIADWAAAGDKNVLPKATKEHLDYAIERQDAIDEVVAYNAQHGVLASDVNKLSANFVSSITEKGNHWVNGDSYWSEEDGAVVISMTFLNIMLRGKALDRFTEKSFHGDPVRAKGVVIRGLVDSGVLSQREEKTRKGHETFSINPSLINKENYEELVSRAIAASKGKKAMQDKAEERKAARAEKRKRKLEGRKDNTVH
jgi:hypothetical protein